MDRQQRRSPKVLSIAAVVVVTMSRLLAELGIGVATVDLIVNAHGVVPGETVDVRLEVEGGSRDQTIEELSIGFATEVGRNGDTDLVAFGQEAMTDPRTIGATETETIQTAVTVPPGTPVTTVGATPVWLTAGLEIDWAPDPAERNVLSVQLPPFLRAVLETLEGESIVCLDATCRPAAGLSVATRYPFVQVFDFQPRGGFYDDDIGSLEVVPTYSSNDPSVVELVVVRDVQRGRLAVDDLDSSGIDWTRVEVPFDADASAIRRKLQNQLDRLVP
jgi:sporulation-control protein